MHPASLLLVSLFATGSSAHGVVTLIKGANGVDMPGLSVVDGTPRDCSTNRCGSQADTSIIRDREISSGRVGPLGRTQGSGPVNASTMIAAFMGTGAAPPNITDPEAASVGVEDDLGQLNDDGGSGGGRGFRNAARQLLKGLLGGGGGGGASGGRNAGQAPAAKTEGNVAALAGQGATSGLPTCSDDGIITMVFHQINQDGAGPLEAAVDGTSGGTDPAAFQQATVTQDVPGLGVGGLSLATSRDFPLQVQMPAGMTCDATVAGVDNVCVVRVRNSALAGPFGGSAAFTMSPAARKRALAYRMKQKRAREFRA
ncbi:uncharacterized protein P884DRAFT_292002 [Thermothelomyces heterothallicus CBS 202.75]|uniref:uncharacterized protein n=1 Tax=Thermothelomyces heterothallicus CBS 202.75 TaxID=1149848 RepID=UPI00374462BA